MSPLEVMHAVRVALIGTFVRLVKNAGQGDASSLLDGQQPVIESGQSMVPREHSWIGALQTFQQTNHRADLHKVRTLSLVIHAARFGRTGLQVDVCPFEGEQRTTSYAGHLGGYK